MSTKHTSTIEKANALASQFENTHMLTHKSISVLESTVNAFYDSIKPQPIINFSHEIPANFKEIESFKQLQQSNELISQCQHYFTSTNEISNFIECSKTKKSCGRDQSSSYILKKMPLTYIACLSITMNHIINTQYYPDAWKHGVITAICKPNKDNTLISSYRPITQLSSISKLLEKKIDSRIRSFCTENKVINDFQFGFQSGKSTEMATSKFVSDVSHGLNNHKPTLAILLDYQAAFDTIWHKALVYKMHRIGLDNNLICLVQQYLTNRSFEVQLNGIKSSKRIVLAGAPQGGILSAIFYLLYTNDFPTMKNCETEIKQIMFADDTIIYSTTDKIKQAKNDLNLYMNKISNYVKCWKLKLNVSKTESIAIIGHYKDLSKAVRKNAKSVEFTINDKKINKCTKVKYLGLIISSNFKSINHISYINDKINAAKAQLKTLFENKYLNPNVKLLMYKQLIRPIILYACSCWMQSSSHQIEKLRVIERWFLRKITNLFKQNNSFKFVESKKLYEISNVNRIDREMVEKNLKFIEKIKSKNDPYINQMLNYDLNYINNNKYKPINYIDHLNSNGLLYENNKLLIFNRGTLNPNALLYVISQNEN